MIGEGGRAGVENDEAGAISAAVASSLISGLPTDRAPVHCLSQWPAVAALPPYRPRHHRHHHHRRLGE